MKKRSTKGKAIDAIDDPKSHLDLRFKEVSASYRLMIEGESRWRRVVSSWSAEKCTDPTKSDTVTYRVRITKPSAKREVLSLLTLGVQSAFHKVIIEKKPGPKNAKARIFPYTPDDTYQEKYPLELPCAGSGDKINKQDVYMIAFKGTTCDLLVCAIGRTSAGRTLWDGDKDPRTTHDNMPPGGTVDR